MMDYQFEFSLGYIVKFLPYKKKGLCNSGKDIRNHRYKMS